MEDAKVRDSLGLRDYLEPGVVWLVEWPERGQGALPASDLDIELAVEGEGRRCRLLPRSPIGQGWLEGLASG